MKSLTAVVLIGIYALAGSYLLSIEIQIVQCKILIVANQCFSVAMKGKTDIAKYSRVKKWETFLP